MIVVTGATGQLGRHVVQQLLEKVPAAQVAVVVRDASKAADLAARGVSVRVADYNQPATVDAALEGAEKVLLISGTEFGKRVAQHTVVTEAAKKRGVKLLAYTSIPHADTTPLKLHTDLLRLTNVDLTLILKNCVDVSAAELARRNHTIEIELPAEAVWIKADAMRLEQVFSNLLGNAAKYTLDGGKIALSLERLEGEIRIRVRDSGIGIPPALLTKIFEMFVQVNSTSTVADGGRGIGLAVVRDLVEMHGGSVTAASAGLGFGSEFTVMLPALWEGSGGVA